MVTRTKEKGFTLVELLIAVGIILLMAAVVVGLFLRHVDRARAANVAENINNIRVALNTTISKTGKHLVDENGDSDYLDDLIELGAISGKPSYPSCGEWFLRKTTDDYGNVAYYIEVDTTDCPEKVENDFQKVDDEIDDSDPNTGQVRSSRGPQL